jgi:peptidoglycan hydrolase-like protein with peptidoglycan-binding domain
VAYLALHNPGIDTTLIGQQCELKKDSDKAFPVPDIITHEPIERTEFYEIKPNSASGIRKGIDKILWFEAICASEIMPYTAGTLYDPDQRITLYGGRYSGSPVRISLHFKRDRAGLLVYDFCVEITQESVNEAMFFALIALLIAILIAFSEGLVLVPAFASATSPMRGTTGSGGANDVDDVAYAQTLLNDWRNRNDRPLIAVDGRSGPDTEAAIREFQAATTGFADGRLDPDGPAITALEQDHINAAATNAAPATQAIADAGGIPDEWHPLFETPDDEEQPIADITEVDLPGALLAATQDYLNRVHDTAKNFS